MYHTFRRWKACFENSGGGGGGSRLLDGTASVCVCVCAVAIKLIDCFASGSSKRLHPLLMCDIGLADAGGDL